MKTGGGRYVDGINHWITLLILGIAVWTDLKDGKIHNRWILTGLIAGLGWMCMSTYLEEGSMEIRSVLPHLKLYLTGMLLPFAMLWIPFRMHGIGAGDVKLCMVIGCLNGGWDVFYCICYSVLLAAGISLGRLLSRRQLLTSLSLCILYIRQLFLVQKIIPYEVEENGFHQIRMAVYLAGGYLIGLGVNVCRNIVF